MNEWNKRYLPRGRFIQEAHAVVDQEFTADGTWDVYDNMPVDVAGATGRAIWREICCSYFHATGMLNEVQ